MVWPEALENQGFLRSIKEIFDGKKQATKKISSHARLYYAAAW
jgi:hypothetical protein